MRKFYLPGTAVLFFFFILSGALKAQDFSNKGKDFWVAYGYHQVMTNGGNAQQMVLYFAADQNTNVTISIPGNGYTQNIFVPANTVVTSNIIPKTGGQDARLTTEGVSDKGIHITADKPVVAYAHIYNMSVSGATILYPTNTLGKEYYSINYTNISNSNNSNCWFYVVAADTGTTTVDIIPSANTTGGWTAGNTYTITLQQGQVYNVMGTFSNTPAPPTGVDLTGSLIKSKNTGTGCKKIAVFSGSGRISITCNGASSSSDNYMVQSVPKAAWGKKYLTVPTAPNMSYNPYRICVSDPATIVKVNGAPIAVPLLNGFYYQLAQTNQPQMVEADKPVMVAQYITSSGACGNGNPGDPEVIYLSPVEQNINKVLWNATSNFNITQHYINVVIPNTGTAISSFLLDGAPVGAAAFITHPGDAGFSYCRIGVTAGQHQLYSDSGFNAIAYGYGNAESYGYNAGTNIKDLFQFVNIKNLHGTVNFPATCRNTPFNLAMVFPYQPIQIDWIFGAALNAVGFNDTTIYNGGSPIPADSSWVVSGRTLYRYRLPRQYTIPAVGTYPIRVLATNPTPDNCGSVQEVTFDLQVFEAPVADFTFTTNGCFNQPVNFFDNSNPGGRPVISRYWDFGDFTNTGLNNPTHTYPSPGTYNVQYTYITDVGCLADTVTHPVVLDPLPIAGFTATAPFCVNQPITFTDISATGGPSSPLAVWTWNFGDATPPVVRTTSTNEVHTYTAAGSYTATLTVQTTSGCLSTVFQFPITILPDAIVTRTSAVGTDNQTVCINNPITNITYSITGSGNAATVTGLPAGVTGSYAAGIFTVSGTPTAAGTFNYTVTGTGTCAPATATGTITVTDDGTIQLSSAVGTDNQTICINTPLTTITYTIGGSATGGAATGLPAGVTGSFAGGVFTISGTPTVAGVFNYTINTTGPCLTPSANGTITVTADGVLTLTSAAGTNNQTVCINNPIVNITYAVTGSSTSGSVSGLPAGVNGSYAGGVVTITGTPTVAGVFNYTVTTTGPCVNPTATGTITVTDNGSITLTSPAGSDNQTICINTALTDITYAVGGSGNGGSVTGLPAGVTGSFAGGVVTITGTPSVAGVFNYTVNTTGPCINPTATGTITVRANGTLTLTSAAGTNNQSVCINVPIINITYAVAGTGNGGSVTGLPAGVSGTYAAGIITITGTPTVVGVFNYTVSTTGPCVNPTAAGSITVNADASITLTSPPPTAAQELCKNSLLTNIVYTVGGTATNATATGLPAGVTGSFSGGIFTISGSPTVAGTFNYTVTATGICQPASKTGTITVNQLPTSNFTATVPTCETRTISFTDNSVPNSGAIISWAWNFGDPISGPLNISSLQNPTHIFATAGTYNVTLVVTTDKGCVSTAPARTVIVNLRPLAGFVLPEVCLSDTYAQFNDSSKVALPDNIQAWAWNFGDPPSGAANLSGLQNPTHSYTATGSYNVQLVATTNKGCKDTVTQVLFVNGSFPQADFNIQNPSALCANDSVSITEASTVFPGTITKVEIYWDNVGQPGVFYTDNFPSTGKLYKHLYPAFQVPLTKVFTIRYRAYSGGVCVNDKFKNVTVNAAPKVQFTAIPNICLDAPPYQITQASEIGGVPGSGVFSGPGVSPTGLFNPAIAGAGTHTIRFMYASTAAGCLDSAFQTIHVYAAAVADFSVSSPACEKQQVVFTNNSISTEGTLAQWVWNFADGTPVVTVNSGAPYSHTFNTYGTFNVTLNVITSNGCRSVAKIIPVIVKPIARPAFSFPAVSCLPNTTINFSNLSTIPDGTESSFIYLWNFGDPGSGPVNNSSQQNPSHTYVAIGPYTINLQVTSGAGCIHDTTIILNSIHPQPIADFTTDKVDVCVGGSVTFTSNSNPMDGTISTYNWTMDDGNVRTAASFSYTYAGANTYNVSHYIINSFNCKSTVVTSQISINPYAIVNAGPDKLMLEGGQVQLTPQMNPTMPVTYSWTPPTYLDNPTIKEPIARPPDDKTYLLTVTTNKGCTRTDDVFIKVLKKPDIPNIFSPNGDGLHDTWEIKYLESYPGCTIDVVNRYGQLVYHSVGYTKPWDGKVNGKEVPLGTYYYVVDPKNGRAKITGFVDIIR